MRETRRKTAIKYSIATATTFSDVGLILAILRQKITELQATIDQQQAALELARKALENSDSRWPYEIIHQRALEAIAEATK